MQHLDPRLLVHLHVPAPLVRLSIIPSLYSALHPKYMYAHSFLFSASLFFMSLPLVETNIRKLLVKAELT